MKKINTHNLVNFVKPINCIYKSIKASATKTVAPFTILVYHSISKHRNKKKDYPFTVEPRLLKLQMNYLNTKNFKVANLSECFDMMQTNSLPKGRTIVLTFDDGYADAYFHAYPILKRLGFSATFFLTYKFIGSKKKFPWLKEPLFPKGENLPLSLNQIQDMNKGGMDFGSHAHSHKKLALLPRKKAFEEIQISKDNIEDLLGQEINAFSYPYGSWSDFNYSHQKMVQKAGFDMAVTSIYGSNNKNSNLFSLRRIPIYANDSLATFEMKINGYYDWIGSVQKHLSLLTI